jgi:hypothetical protein
MPQVTLHNGDTYNYFSLSSHKQTEKTRNHVYKGFEGILYGFLHMLCCIVDDRSKDSHWTLLLYYKYFLLLTVETWIDFIIFFLTIVVLYEIYRYFK